MESKKGDALTALFVAILVLSNILSAKLITIGPVIVPGGIICYAITFLISDVLNERYGKEYATRAMYIGLVAQIISSALIALTVALPGAEGSLTSAFDAVMGTTPWFVIASLVSFVFAQTADIAIFHGIRKRLMSKGRRCKWVWNNLSTIISQIIDTGIYVTIAFGIGQGYFFQADMRWLLLQMAVSQIIVKVVLAIADTPLFYALTRR